MTRKCRSCDKDISELHGRTQRCPKCSKLHRNERMRSYMAKRNLRQRWDNTMMRTEGDVGVLADHHMTGLGTFVLTKYREDIRKEYEDIQKLKAMTKY